MVDCSGSTSTRSRQIGDSSNVERARCQWARTYALGPAERLGAVGFISEGDGKCDLRKQSSVPERLAQGGDVKPEGAFVNGNVLPHACEDMEFSDYLASVLHQDAENAERTRTQVAGLPVLPQEPATRYDKTACSYFATLQLAAVRIWLRFVQSA
jgi:hypothetical protein